MTKGEDEVKWNALKGKKDATAGQSSRAKKKEKRFRKTLDKQREESKIQPRSQRRERAGERRFRGEETSGRPITKEEKQIAAEERGSKEREIEKKI